jgi:carboxymethylenebutenolidase
MCFDHDSRPPIAPIAGGALDAGDRTLRSADGTTFRAFRAHPAESTGAGVLILPDVRGLHPYYEELALRFAEAGIDALAIDYFGRSAGIERRDEGFEFMPHVEQTTWDGLQADVRAGADALRVDDGTATDVQHLFTVGFCYGGRLAFLSTTLGLDLAGAIGFYGTLVGPGRAGMPAPVDVADRVEAPILGLFGGADQAITAEHRTGFDRALEGAGVEHRIVAYDGAPHSFFDRKATEFADASASAWDEVLAFIRERGGQIGA